MAYCEKYRKSAVEYKDSGHTFEEVKETFKISSSTYYKWVKYKEEFGSYVPPKKGKQTRKGKIDPDKLVSAYEEKPDAYLREIALLFDCSAEAVRKRLKTLKLTLKKRRLPTRKKTKKKERSMLKR
jgi:transposase